MIDLKAARNDPDGFRAALARKGAADAFDALLEADERWRALVPRIDELRGRTKVKGKPSPEQLAELQQVKEELRSAEEDLAVAEEERDRVALQVPTAASTWRSAASTWSGRRGCPAPASATGSATRRSSRSRSTGSRSTGSRRRASSPSCRRSSSARRR
jgi:Seryl-tRNA synthetase N-terminal domain